MIDGTQLAAAFDRNVQLVKRQCEGLSQADSLIQTPYNINSLNWIVGHIVDNRDSVLRLLGAEPAFGEEGARYRRNTDPIKAEGEGVLPLARLLAILEKGQAQITERLNSATPEQLSKEIEHLGHKQSVGAWLFFLYFHDAYHVGQTDLLRQVAGKNDKII